MAPVILSRRRRLSRCFLYWRQWAARRATACRRSSFITARRARPRERRARSRRPRRRRRSSSWTTRPATGSRRVSRREAPSARVVSEPSNRGFGAACNRGARETARPYPALSQLRRLRPARRRRRRSLRPWRRLPGAAAAAPRLAQSRRLAPALDPAAALARGGSSARARAWRFSRAAGAPFAGHSATRAGPRQTSSRSRRSRARRFSSGAPTSRRRAASTRPSSSTRRRRISSRAGAAWAAVSSSSRAPRWCTREEPRRAIVSSASSTPRSAATPPSTTAAAAATAVPRRPLGRRRASIRDRPSDAGRAGPRPARALPRGALGRRMR